MIINEGIKMSKLEKLLGKSKHEGESLQSTIQSKNNLIAFTFDGKEYYVAIRESILVFDENMTLLYNFETNELATSSNEFVQKVNEVVNSNSNDLVHLYINKVTGVEHITFSSLFDATYIYRKIKRLMGRDSEGITSLIIEKDSKTIRSANNEKLAFKENMDESYAGDVEDRAARDEEKTEYIATLSRVEDLVDNIICQNVSELGLQKDDEKIKKAIELLSNLVEDETDEENEEE